MPVGLSYGFPFFRPDNKSIKNKFAARNKSQRQKRKVARKSK